MDTLRALTGIIPLVMLFVVFLIGVILALLFFLAFLLFVGLATVLFVCVAVPILLLLVIGSMIELIPAMLRKRPVWSCQLGKVLVGRSMKLAEFVFNDSADWTFDQLDSSIDKIEQVDPIGQINARFGTSKFFGRLINWVNSVCTGSLGQNKLT